MICVYKGPIELHIHFYMPVQIWQGGTHEMLQSEICARLVLSTPLRPTTFSWKCQSILVAVASSSSSLGVAAAVARLSAQTAAAAMIRL